MKVTNVKVPPGFYKADGTKVNSTGIRPKDYKPQPGDVIVTPKGSVNIYAESKSGVSKFYPYHGGRSLADIHIRKSRAGQNVDYPEALHSHITAEKDRNLGGRKPRGYKAPEVENLVIQDGKWVLKGTPKTVSPDLEKELDRAWTVRNKPPVKSAFDTIEGFNLATSRYNDWNEAKKKHGTTFNKLDANNKLDDKEQNYAYVVNQEGWTKGNLLQEIPLRNQKGGKLHDIKGIIERNQWLVKPKEWEEVHGKPPPKNVFQNQTQSPSTTPSNAQSSTSGLGIPKDNTLIASANVPKTQKNNLDYGDGTDNTNLSSYEQDATTSWGRGSYNTKGTTKDIKSRNQRTMAYWGGKQDSGGKGYDFSGYRGDDRDLARALRTGEAWETGKGTIIYQPDRGPMQVFKQSATKPIIEKGPDDNIASKTNKEVPSNA